MAEGQPSAPSVGEASASGLRVAVSKAGGRIQEIIDTAERVAREIREEAEHEAAEYLRERRQHADRLVAERERELTELTEAIAARAGRVRRDLQGLLETLQEAIERITPLGLTASPSDSLSLAAQPGQQHDRAARPHEQALLRAAQMAATGSDREHLERTLRDEFGISDASTVVDEILGPRERNPGSSLGTFTGPARGDRPGQRG